MFATMTLYLSLLVTLLGLFMNINTCSSQTQVRLEARRHALFFFFFFFLWPGIESTNATHVHASYTSVRTCSPPVT